MISQKDLETLKEVGEWPFATRREVKPLLRKRGMVTQWRGFDVLTDRGRLVVYGYLRLSIEQREVLMRMYRSHVEEVVCRLDPPPAFEDVAVLMDAGYVTERGGEIALTDGGVALWEAVLVGYYYPSSIKRKHVRQGRHMERAV